ncbi:hypothetical protein QYE76_032527 [Lolium multiflorum]|uniref:Uncharacterized protein n=1 Tax=Lolium multiflorum TaxID=4521 RepID=A0AAD8VJG2_LOLMU|nr:hypothetical protein QYE76_032527 [Lolium multiflorum]
MDALAVLEAMEPTALTAHAIHETAPMVGSKRATSTGCINNTKVPKKLLTPDEQPRGDDEGELQRRKPYLAMDTLAALEAVEPTTVTAPIVDETALMAGSKRAASTDGDKKTKVPKKLLTPEEKVIHAAK